MLDQYNLEAASFPKAKAKPQPCFTTDQVDALIDIGRPEEKLAFALMGYAGLRIGEAEQLRCEDIIIKDGQFTMIHVRRGGSNGTTKDRDERFVPIHPKVAELLAGHKKTSGPLLKKIKSRGLLKRLKVLCTNCEFENPRQYKLHSFRHHFASMCANHGVAYRKVLAWLGHSSSEMLDLYYHLNDEESHKTMMDLAKSHEEENHFEDRMRTERGSKIVGIPQADAIKELAECLCFLAESEGFDLALFCKLVKGLHLRLISDKSKDLSSLVSLLFKHDFLRL